MDTLWKNRNFPIHRWWNFSIINLKNNLLLNYFDNFQVIFESLLDVFFQYWNFSSVVLEFFKVRHAIFGTSLNIPHMIYIKISKHILVNYFQYFIGSFKKNCLESINEHFYILIIHEKVLVLTFFDKTKIMKVTVC